VCAFYGALGIELPAWAQRNAPIRCFADPAAHAHEDRTPSCSVNLEHGAWQCFACGARGGAYDAALLRGHTPSSAMELLVAHQLAEPFAPLPRLRALRAPIAQANSVVPPGARHGRVLACDEQDIARWHEALFSPARGFWLERLCDRRLWSVETMRALFLGYDRGRITIPIRDADCRLRGALRYHPEGRGRKMLAVPGTQLGLIPHPAQEQSPRVLLVEGPPDMIAARSRGWPAIAVPGSHAWQSSWAKLLAGRDVLVLMDADAVGRSAAERITADLQPVCEVRVVDLAPERRDGFDLTDWLHHHPRPRRTRCTTSSSSNPTITR